MSKGKKIALCTPAVLSALVMTAIIVKTLQEMTGIEELDFIASVPSEPLVVAWAAVFAVGLICAVILARDEEGPVALMAASALGRIILLPAYALLLIMYMTVGFFIIGLLPLALLLVLLMYYSGQRPLDGALPFVGASLLPAISVSAFALIAHIAQARRTGITRKDAVMMALQPFLPLTGTIVTICSYVRFRNSSVSKRNAKSSAPLAPPAPPVPGRDA